MTNSLSVLSQFAPHHLSLDPYPHLVIEDALNIDLANQLLGSFPSAAVVDVDNSQNNVRWSYSAQDALLNPQVANLWKQFVSYHISREFWDEICTVFGGHLESILTKPENKKCISPSRRIGLRGLDNFDAHDVQLEAQISGNTPVRKPTSVRGTHLDEGNKIFSGLYYLRDSADESTGGEFTLQRWKNWVPDRLKSFLYFEGMYDCVEEVKKIPYRHNTLVILLDSIDSLHSVTPRSETAFTRKFLNLDGVLPAHEYHTQQPNVVSRIRRQIGLRRN